MDTKYGHIENLLHVRLYTKEYIKYQNNLNKLKSSKKLFPKKANVQFSLTKLGADFRLNKEIY